MDKLKSFHRDLGGMRPKVRPTPLHGIGFLEVPLRQLISLGVMQDDGNVFALYVSFNDVVLPFPHLTAIEKTMLKNEASGITRLSRKVMNMAIEPTFAILFHLDLNLEAGDFTEPSDDLLVKLHSKTCREIWILTSGSYRLDFLHGSFPLCWFIQSLIDLADFPYPTFPLMMIERQHLVGRPVEVIRDIGYLLC